jgi:hypothetical protein
MLVACLPENSMGLPPVLCHIGVHELNDIVPDW